MCNKTRRESLITALLLLLFASPSWSETPDPAVTWASYRQEVLPAFAKRSEVARRQLSARKAWESGKNSFEDAFPKLVGAQLERPAVVRGLLLDLQAKASAREGERQAALPELGSPAHAKTAGAARAKALDDEEAADALLRRWLTRVDAHLKLHPELTDSGLASLRAPLEAAVRQAAETDADPEAQAAADARAAAADQDLAALDRLQTALRMHATTGAALPPVDDAIAAVDDPLHREAAVGRLSLIRAFATGPQKESADKALVAYFAGPALESANAELAEARAAVPAAKLSGEDEAVLQTRVAEAQEALTTMEAELAATPEDQLDRPIKAIQVETQRQKVALVQRLVELRGSAPAAEVDAAVADAERARRQAQTAAASAQDDEERSKASFLASAADASERLQLLTELLGRRKQSTQQAEKELQGELDDLSTMLEEIEDSSPLPGSGPDADEAYGTLRTLRLGLMDGEVARGDGVQTATERVAEARARGAEDRLLIQTSRALTSPDIEEARKHWRATLDKEAIVAEDLLILAHDEREVVLSSLQTVNEMRRSTRPYISWRQTDLDSEALFSDIGRELKLLGPTIYSRVGYRVKEILSFPKRLFRDPTLIGGVFSGIFWTVVLWGGWAWGRGKSDAIAGRLTIQLRRIRPSLRPIDLHRLKGPTTDAVRAVIDLSLGQLMVWRISPLSPEIAFLVQAWLLLAIYRACLAIFDLAVVKAPEFRLSFVALAPPAHELVRFSARVFIIWMIARGFTYYVLWGMLQLDSLTEFVMRLFWFVGLGLTVWLLYQWDPMLRERIRARNQDSTLVAFLSRDVPRPLRPFSAMAMLIFFIISMSSDFVYFLLARDRTGLARVFNVISRFQMTDEETQAEEKLEPEIITTLCDSKSSHPVYVERPAFDEAFDKGFSTWMEQGRRGMLSLVGDRGEGKRTEFHRIAEKVGREDLTVVRARMQHVQTNERVLLDWLAELVDLPRGLEPDDLIERLRALDRRVFLLEQMHRTFSRSVGGFQGISTLLYVLNGSSDQHLWVLGMHRPAWRYLASIPSLVDVGVFALVLSLDPFDATMLRELTENRCGAAELRIDFTSLMRANLLGADPEVELERSVNSFYRLLAEASEGNPRVAMHLFSSCLDAGKEPHTAMVRTRRALATEVASEVGVDALFTLVALRQQDAMTLQEIVEVTNLAEHRVRNTVRDLQSRELVAANKGQLYIPIHRLPLVSRTLRRRHLLYLGN